MSCVFYAGASTLRLTRLDDCGVPVTGTKNGFVAECFTSVAMALKTEDQDDKIYKTPTGKVCAYKKGCRSFLGYDVTVNIDAISPEAMDILTQQPVVMNAATPAVPVGWDNCNIPCTGGFALELWAEIIQDACPTTGPEYLYLLMPWLQGGAQGDMEWGADQLTLEITAGTRAGGGWDVGPYLVVPDATNAPSKLLTPLGATCHRRIQKTTVPPPTATCDYTPVVFP